MKRILVVLFFFGCSDAGVEPFVDPPTKASFVRRAGLNTATATLTNHTPETIYYMAIDQELLALIDWAPSLDPNSKINPGGSVVLSSERIAGYKPGKDFVLFWWTFEPDGESSHYRVKSFNSRVITSAILLSQNLTIAIHSL